jgi:hypothetical protein
MRPRRLAALPLVTLIGLPLLAAGSTSQAGALAGLQLSATAESYAYRVEYDLPLPAGTGTVAHVNATIARSPSGESAHGTAAAPTEFDAVVAGKYIDPTGTGHPQRRLPQAECAYPGKLLDRRFAFPTDTQAETAGLPATSYAIANCQAGPQAQLRVRNGPVGDPYASMVPAPSGMITSDAVSSDALARPDKDVLVATSQSRAQGLAVAGGVLHIGSVVASGASQTAGAARTGHSTASVSVSDIDAGGVKFSLESSQTDGTSHVDLTAGGVTVPLASSQGQTVLSAANAALQPVGCGMSVLASPAHYPQGFLFSRPEPETGVKPDGSLAASYHGGLVIVCDVPNNPAAQATQFSPERVQILVGFVYTSAAAHAPVGGFNLGDIAGGPTDNTSSRLPGQTITPAILRQSATSPDAVAAPGLAGAGVTPPAVAPVARSLPHLRASAGPFGMDPTARWILAAVCLVVWGILTHLGISRLLAVSRP